MSKGLGDTVEKITKATGIKQATDWIFDKLGKDCGCDARNEEEYIYLKGFFTLNKNIVNNIEQKELLTIHNRVFNTNKKASSCGSCVKGLVDTMKRLYNEYEYERESKSN